MQLSCPGQRDPQPVITETAAAAVTILALGREQRRTGPGVVGVEVARAAA